MAIAISGEKLLRNIMLGENNELWGRWNMWNLYYGPYGVDIIDGKDLVNDRTNAELQYLKKACLPRCF
ncbi:hypothetical protein OROMI_008745 [Orobanche minor]